MLSAADLVICRGTRDKLSCGRKVRLTRTASGAALAVDPSPTPDGNTAVWRDVHGVLRSRRITAERPLVPPEKRMTPHVATCTGRPRVAPPPPPPKAGPAPGELYNLLGVPRTATQDDIRRAYRRLARTLHSDLHATDDPESLDKFKRIGLAYHVLSDPSRRQSYDLTGRTPRAR